MAGMSNRPQPPHVRAWQAVLNEHWPANPQAVRGDRLNAKKVRARVVFEGDGEVWLEGKAERWNSDAIYVFIPNDKRISTNGVWLKPEDVYRMYDQSMMQDK